MILPKIILRYDVIPLVLHEGISHIIASMAYSLDPYVGGHSDASINAIIPRLPFPK